MAFLISALVLALTALRRRCVFREPPGTRCINAQVTETVSIGIHAPIEPTLGLVVGSGDVGDLLALKKLVLFGGGHGWHLVVLRLLLLFGGCADIMVPVLPWHTDVLDTDTFILRSILAPDEYWTIGSKERVCGCFGEETVDYFVQMTRRPDTRDARSSSVCILAR
jgi:hypothetical protein